MAGIEVGSVSVSVVPSAENFAPKMSAIVDSAMKPITSRISAAIGDAITKGIGDGFKDAPTAPAKEKGTESGGAFADGFKVRVTEALKSLPKVEINADSSDADRKIQEIRGELEALSKQQVGVDISDEDAIAKLTALRLQLDEIGKAATSVQVRADVATASAALEAFQLEVDRINGEKATVDVDVDDHGSLEKAESGFTGLTSGFSGMATAALALGPAIVPIGAVLGAGFLSILSPLAAATAGMAAFAAVAGPQVSSALKDQKKNTDLLTGSQREFLGALDAVKSAFDAISASAGPAALGVVTAGLTAALPLVQDLIPLLNAALPALSGLVGEFGNAFALPGFQDFVQTLATNIPQAVTDLGHTILDLGQIVGNFITAVFPLGDTVLLNITNGLDSIAASSDHLAQSQGFKQFVSYVMANAPAVGGLIKDLFTFVGNLVEALAPLGTTILSAIVDFAGAISRIPVSVLRAAAVAAAGLAVGLKSLSTLSSLITLVAGLDPLVVVIGGIAAAVALLALHSPQIGDIKTELSSLGQTVGPLLEQLGDTFVTKVLPSLEQFAGFLVVNVIPVVNQLAAEILPVLNTVLGQFGDALKIILPVIEPVIGFLLKLSPIFVGLELLISPIGLAIAGVTLAFLAFKAAISGIEDIGQPIVAFFGTTLPNALSAALGFLEGLPGKIGAALSSAVSAVAAFGSRIAASIGSGLTQAAASVVSFGASLLADVGSALAKVPGLLLTAVETAGQAILTFLLDLPTLIAYALLEVPAFLIGLGIGAVKGLVAGFNDAKPDVIAFFTALPGEIVTALADFGSTIADAATTGFITIGSAVSTGIAAVVTFFTNFPGQAVTALATFGSDIGSAVTTGFVTISTAVSTGASAVVAFFTALPGQAVTALGDLGSSIAAVGTSALESLGTAITTGIPAVLKTIAGLASSLVSAISAVPGKLLGLASTFTSAGKTLMGDVFSGLESAATASGKFASNIATTIANDLIDGLNRILPHHIHLSIPFAPDVTVPLFPDIPHLAAGGPIDGLSLVGELGPELYVPKSAGTIIPANLTASILSSVSGLASQYSLPPSLNVPTFMTSHGYGDASLDPAYNLTYNGTGSSQMSAHPQATISSGSGQPVEILLTLDNDLLRATVNSEANVVVTTRANSAQKQALRDTRAGGANKPLYSHLTSGY